MALENLSPVVREERLLAGEDLEPVTRLEYFLKQAGSGGGNGLPAYDDEDIGKVLTVGSEYETGAEAIPAQTVTIAQGTATVQNANVSQWTAGQWVSVTYRGTTYTGQITDVEGSLVFVTDDFTLSYNSSTGVLTVEDNEHSGDNSISARYVTEHANADWVEPSGGSGSGTSLLIATIERSVDMETGVLDKTWRECKNADAIILREAGVDSLFYYVTSVAVHRDLLDPTNVSYDIEFMVPATYDADEFGNVKWILYKLSTDTETGYPEVSFVL